MYSGDREERNEEGSGAKRDPDMKEKLNAGGNKNSRKGKRKDRGLRS